MTNTLGHTSTSTRAWLSPASLRFFPAPLRPGAFALALLLGPVLFGQNVPSYVNYQGTLTDAAGQPLTGAHALAFRVYDAATAGNLVWGPQTFKDTTGQPGGGTDNRVRVINGRFNVILGPQDEATPTPRDLSTAFTTGSTRYVELTVDDSTQPVQPRQQILTAPFAFVAQTATVATTATSAVNATNVGGQPLTALMTKATYDADGNGKVDNADLAQALPAGASQTSATVIATYLSNRTEEAVPGLTVTLTTRGRPVYVGLQNGYVMVSKMDAGPGGDDPPTWGRVYIMIKRDGVEVTNLQVGLYIRSDALNNTVSTGPMIPASAVATVDTPPAGTHTYTVYGRLMWGNHYNLEGCRLVAIEL